VKGEIPIHQFTYSPTHRLTFVPASFNGIILQDSRCCQAPFN